MENLKSINVTNVCKRHGPKDILMNGSFEANPGRVTAFLGHNGAGKSSTLRILLGLDHPLTGTHNILFLTSQQMVLILPGYAGFGNLFIISQNKVKPFCFPPIFFLRLRLLGMNKRRNNLPDCYCGDCLYTIFIADFRLVPGGM